METQPENRDRKVSIEEIVAFLLEVKALAQKEKEAKIQQSKKNTQVSE